MDIPLALLLFAVSIVLLFLKLLAAWVAKQDDESGDDQGNEFPGDHSAW